MFDERSSYESSEQDLVSQKEVALASQGEGGVNTQSLQRDLAHRQELAAFPQNFFSETWSALLVDQESALKLTGDESPFELAQKMYEELKPSLDVYIEKYNLPTSKLADETDEGFFKRIVDSMYNLNERNIEHKGWKDCWPSTALEVGRTNCAVGSLVVARVLEQAGYQDEVYYGFPGPMTHAVIISRGKYIDQANGVVLDVEKDSTIDGIETFKVIESQDPEEMYKVPFRRIPVTTVSHGVAPLVWNMGSMLHRGGKVAEELTERFHLDHSNPYSHLGRKRLLGEKWDSSRMLDEPAWRWEKAGVESRIGNE